jgi:hypothetical protein
MLAVAAFVVSSACEGIGITESECDARYACQVEGVDLAVVTVTVSGVTSYNGTVAVDPSNVTISFVVVNRGDQTSRAGVSAEAGVFGAKQIVELPAIAPGDSAVRITSVSIDRAYLLAGDDPETENAVVRVLTPDAVSDNDAQAGPRIRLNIPYVSLNPVIMPPQTVRMGERITTSFSLQVSWYQHSVDVLVCLRAGNRTCTYGNWQPMMHYDNLNSGRASLYPLSAAAVPAPANGQYELIYCVVPAGYTGTYLDLTDADHRCRTAGIVTVVVDAPTGNT